MGPSVEAGIVAVTPLGLESLHDARFRTATEPDRRSLRGGPRIDELVAVSIAGPMRLAFLLSTAMVLSARR